MKRLLLKLLTTIVRSTNTLMRLPESPMSLPSSLEQTLVSTIFSYDGESKHHRIKHEQSIARCHTALTASIDARTMTVKEILVFATSFVSTRIACRIPIISSNNAQIRNLTKLSADCNFRIPLAQFEAHNAYREAHIVLHHNLRWS